MWRTDAQRKEEGGERAFDEGSQDVGLFLLPRLFLSTMTWSAIGFDGDV